MIQENDIIWLDENQSIFLNVKLTSEQVHQLFRIYNEITGENKGVTGCGRCVANVKKRVKAQLDKQTKIF
jgi:CBS domain containing-hemolysin-like protein